MNVECLDVIFVIITHDWVVHIIAYIASYDNSTDNDNFQPNLCHL